MDNYSLEIYKLPEQIPRKSLIKLLKKDRVPEHLLNWASTQVDREIALAILMNSQTNQQHLETFF